MGTSRLIAIRTPIGDSFAYRGIRLHYDGDQAVDALNAHYSNLTMLRDLISEGDIQQIDEFGDTIASVAIQAPVNAPNLHNLMKHRQGAHLVSIFDVAGDWVSLLRDLKSYNRAVANDDALSEDETVEQAGTWLHMIDGIEALNRELREDGEHPLAA